MLALLPLYIGQHRLPHRLFLAPMAGITDAPFRRLCAEQGASFAASEMISSDTLLHATDKTRHRVQRLDHSLPHAIQIAGSEPRAMAEAAAFNVSLGAEIIDINMGCPAKKVCNRAAGSALLEHPVQVRAILQAVTGAVKVPVTLKMRTGPTPAWRNGVEIARLAQDCGIQLLAVHGRTRADRFTGHAEYDTIAAIKQAVDIPVIANGDIMNVADARAVLAHTSADGVMIGRAAQGNPWVFSRLLAELSGLAPPAPPDPEQVGRTLLQHVDALHELYGHYRGVRIARKHIAWYCRGVRHANAFRQRINTVECRNQQRAFIESFFAQPERFAERCEQDV